MKPNLFLISGAIAAILLSWTRVARPARGLAPQALEFRELKLHLEVDLPSPWGPERSNLSKAAMLRLPAEVVLQTEVGEALRQVRMCDGSGKRTFELACPDATALAVTELELQCQAATLGQALREFPAGDYFVEGLTMSGVPVQGTVRLSHEFPGPFVVLSPRPDEVVPTARVELSWTPSQGAARYFLEIEHEQTGFSFEITLPPSQTSFAIPETLLRAGECYEYSLAVEGDTDNQLEVEGTFWTGPLAARRSR